jgi:hypothetical protein
MRKLPYCLAASLVLVLSACSGTASETAPNRLNLTDLKIDDPKADVRFPALLTYETKGEVTLLESCFCLADAGPYCFGLEGDGGPGVARSMLVAGYDGAYQVQGYLRYLAGGETFKSNTLETEITVSPKY